MSSSIEVPSRDAMGDFPPEIAKRLIAVADAAKDDIELLEAADAALQAGAVAGLAPVRFVRGASTANIADLAACSTTFDGLTLVAGNRILLKDQSTGAENGIYAVGTVDSGSAPLTRVADLNASAEVQNGLLVVVSAGTANAGKVFALTTIGAITLGSTALTFSKVASSADATFLDSTHGAAGANLTDADATIQITAGAWRKLPAATLSAGRALTLGTTGAVAGDQITVTRLDATANTYAVINGGAGAGTLLTMPASKVNFGLFQFDGTNWALRACGTQ